MKKKVEATPAGERAKKSAICATRALLLKKRGQPASIKIIIIRKRAYLTLRRQARRNNGEGEKKSGETGEGFHRIAGLLRKMKSARPSSGEAVAASEHIRGDV